MYNFESSYYKATAIKDVINRKEGLVIMVFLRDNHWEFEENPSFTFNLFPENCDINSRYEVSHWICDNLLSMAEKRIKKEKKDRESMTMEVAIDITSNVFSKMIEKTEDSREVVIQIREWAYDFENWWWLLDEDTQEEYDYLTMVDNYSEWMLDEYLQEDYMVEVKLPLFTRIFIKAASKEDAVRKAERAAMNMSIEKFERPDRFECEAFKS